MFTIPTVMNTTSSIDGYTEESAQIKKVFHSKGKTMLKAIAKCLDLTDFDLRSNVAGPAVSGEITLHADNIYIQVYELFGHVSILYRSCHSKKDYTGGTNNNIKIKDLKSTESKERFIARCKQLMNNYQ